MVPKTEIDYIKIYAEKLKSDSSIFDSQKRFIESQLKASISLFRNAFPKNKFKEKAREYLKARMLVN